MEARIFHADDWGISPAVNRGILELAKRGQLRSASLMAKSRFVSLGLSELLEWGVSIYLHLDFTSDSSHKRFLLRSWTGRLDPEQIENEIREQIGILTRAKVPIVGVNGHHHVHLVPGVVHPLLKVMSESGIANLLVLDDPDHLWSSLQTRSFKFLYSKSLDQINLERALYLRPKNLANKLAFQSKIENARASKYPLLVHPALWDDFAQYGVNDSLREQRVVELRAILRYAHGE